MPQSIFRLALQLLLFSFGSAFAVEFHVSPSGNDANTGSPVSPFATPFRALTAVREWKTAHPDDVNRIVLHGGEYVLETPLTLIPGDSGKADAPLYIEAAPGEVPVLTSGRQITGWRIANPATPGLQPSAVGHVFEADIPVGWRFHFLYLDGSPQAVAAMSKTNDWSQWPKPVAVGNVGAGGQPLTLPAGLLDGVPSNGDLEMNLIPVNYWNTLSVIRDINAATNSCRRHSKNPTTFWPNSFGYSPGQFGNFNLLNALKFLTRPGEWCVDSSAGKVWYWPPNDTLAGKSVVAPRLQRLMELQGDPEGPSLVKHVKIRGITFTCTDRLPEDEWPDEWVKRQAELPDAMLHLDGVADCVIEGNRFLHSGSYGVALENYSQRVSVIRNEIAYPGCGGVLLQGFGPGTTDVNRDNVIHRNYIHHTGNGGYLHSAAVTLYQSGRNDIALNWVDSVPYVGIQIAGAGYAEYGPSKVQGAWDSYGKSEAMYKTRWAELPSGVNSTFTRESFKPYLHSRSNHVRDNILTGFVNRLSDGGGLYSWGCGNDNVWEANLLRRDFTNPSEQWCFAIYMDDYVDAATVRDNVCWHTSSSKTLNKGTNVWTNNTVSSTKPANYDSRLREIAIAALDEGGWPAWPEGAMAAFISSPSPSDTHGNVSFDPSPALSWKANVPDLTYDFYFGTDAAAVAAATSLSPEYRGRLATTQFTLPGTLDPGKTYFWRVDAVTQGEGALPGAVWSFTTAPDSMHAGLIAHLTLDDAETESGFALDLVGPPYQDGTHVPSGNPFVITSGHRGDALHLDGTSEMLAVPVTLPSTGYTVSFWFRTTNANAGLFSMVSATGTSSDSDLYLTAGKLNARMSNGGTPETIGSTTALADGQWHHVVHTVGVDTPVRRKLYVDGALAATGSVITSDPTQQMTVRLGFSLATGNYLAGDLDEVQLWERSLSAGEIVTLNTTGLNSDSGGTFTWTGAASQDWNTAANWQAMGIPAAADTAVFGPASSTDLAGTAWIKTLSFTGSSSITGDGTLVIGTGGIALDTPGIQVTLAPPISLRTSQTWTSGESGTLVAAGALDTGGQTLTLSGSSLLHLSGGISGGGGLVVDCTGVAMLSGTSNYTGDTDLHGGTLWVKDAATFASRHVTLDSDAILHYELAGGVQSQSPATISQSKVVTHTGSGRVVVTGGGFLVFGRGSAVTFNLARGGVFDVEEGDVQFGWNTASFASNFGSLHVESGAGYHNSDAAFQFDALTGYGTVGNAYSSSVTLTLGVADTVDNLDDGASGGVASFYGSIKDHESYNSVTTGNLNLIKTGSGTQVLAGVNTYQGTTTVNKGTLRVDGSLSTASAVTVQAGARLAGSGTIKGPVTLQNGGVLAPGGDTMGTLTLNNALSLATGSSVAMRIGKQGAMLSSDRVQFSNGVVFNGTLAVVSNGDPLAAGDRFVLFCKVSGSFSGTFTSANLPSLPSGLVWDLSALAQDGSITVVSQSSGVTKWVSSSGGSWSNVSQWLGNVPSGFGVIADFSTLDLAADATVTLDGARTVGGLLFADVDANHSWTLSPGSAGTLTIGGLSPQVTVLNASATVDAPLLGTTGLSKNGTGNLNLSAASYTGPTFVKEGVLNFRNPTSAAANGTGGFSSSAFDVAAGATLQFALTTDWRAPNNSLVFTGSGTLLKTGSAAMKLGGSTADYASTVSFGHGALIDIQGGKIQLDYAYNKTTWNLNRASLNIAAGAMFDLWDYGNTGGATVKVDALIGNGTVQRGISGTTTGGLEVGVDNGSGNFGGLIQNGVGTSKVNLLKSGTGIQTLSSANTYTGTTTVNAGTLAISNTTGSATGTGVVTIKSGATLGGTGAASGGVVIEAGAFLAPGVNGLGTLAMGSAVLTGTYRCQLGSYACDRISISGTLTSSAAATIAISTMGTPTGAEYVIATYASLSGGLPTVTGIPSGYSLNTATPGVIKLVLDNAAYTDWINSFTTLTNPGDKQPNGDPDKDGLPNIIEYVIGGDPTSAGTEGLPAATISGGNLVFTYICQDEAEFLNPFVEFDTDLSGPWATAQNGVNCTISRQDYGAGEIVTVTIPMGANTKLFARLCVTIPPTLITAGE